MLLFSIHHIIADGWSLGVLVRELRRCMRRRGGGEAALPALPVQYRDYAAWQRKWLQGEVLEQQLAYWREQLAGAPACWTLPDGSSAPGGEDLLAGHR